MFLKTIISVQREVNHVQLIQGWLETAPALVFVFFAGAMSDRMGSSYSCR